MPARAHRHKVLLVDDDPEIQQLLVALLNEENYEVLLGSDGCEAVEMTRTERPHVVVLDVTMPGKDGIEACREIKADPSTANVAVVLLTGRSGFEDRARAEDAGADAYLVKPFSPISFLKTVELLFERRAYS
jgi:DNA-binding response OmpR family regulator